MRKCKCGCGIDISNKHPNAKFFSLKHKDKFHNINNPRGMYAHLNPERPEYEEKAVWEMPDAEWGEWDHGDCGIN